MPNRLRTSDQARALLQDLEVLLKVIDAETSPLARHLNDPQLGGQVRECQAIYKSLTQFSETASGLRYVGFIGHFSAGKSSTINSILGTERDVGLHPTDTGITFLTHKRNQNELIGASGGRTLGIVTFVLDNEDLLDFVFVDTPGTGDPNIVSELVRDFLPVCDRIVYMMSATQPLSESELPILSKASEELSFIPVTFVVTRADEFRRDGADRLSAANIDAGKQQEFMVRLRERLAANLPHLRFNPDDVVIIDNKSGYGVPELRRRLISKSSYAEDIPAKKIEYFTRRIARSKSSIREFARDQLATARTLAAASEANARKYEEDISVSLNHLREDWKHIEARCENLRKASLASLDLLRTNAIGDRSAEEIVGSIFDTERKGALALASHESVLRELVLDVRQRFESAARARVEHFAKGLRDELRKSPKVGTAQKFFESFSRLEALKLAHEDNSAVASVSLSAAAIILPRIEEILCARMNELKGSIRREWETINRFIDQSAIESGDDELFQKAREAVLAAVNAAANSVAVYATALQASPNWLPSLFKLKIAEDLAAAVTNVIPPDVQAKEVDKLLAEFFVTRSSVRDALKTSRAARNKSFQQAIAQFSDVKARSFSDASSTGDLTKLFAERLHSTLIDAIGAEYQAAVMQQAKGLIAKVQDLEQQAKTSTTSSARRARRQSLARRAAVVTAGLLGGVGPFLLLLASPLGGVRMQWWRHLIAMALAFVAAAGLSYAVGGSTFGPLESGAANYPAMGVLIVLGSAVSWFVTALFDNGHRAALRLQNEAFRDSVDALPERFTNASIQYPGTPVAELLGQLDNSEPLFKCLEEHEISQGFFASAARTVIAASEIRTDQVNAVDLDVQNFLSALQGWYGENTAKVDRCNQLVRQWQVGAVEPSLRVIQRTAQQLTELVTKVS